MTPNVLRAIRSVSWAVLFFSLSAGTGATTTSPAAGDLGSAITAPVGDEPTLEVTVASWSDEQVEASLREALLQPEYHNLRREVAASPLRLDWLERLLERLFGDRDSSDGLHPDSTLRLPDLSEIVIVLVVLTVVFAIVAWVRARKSGTDTARPTETTPVGSGFDGLVSGDHLTLEWLERARALAASGHHAAAIRCLLFAGMSWTEEHGLVRNRPGLTNHFYIRALSTQPTQSSALREIVDAFERVYFGHRKANAELFARCLQTFRKGFLHGDGP